MTDINIFSNEFSQNRYAFLEKFRENGKVVFSTLSNCWVILGYNEAAHALSDYKKLSLVPIYSGFDSILGTDMPEHIKNKKTLQNNLDVFNNSEIHEFYTNKFTLICKRLMKRIYSMESFDIIAEFVIPYSISAGLTILKLENISTNLNVLDLDNDLEEVVSSLKEFGQEFGFTESSSLLKMINEYGMQDNNFKSIIDNISSQRNYNIKEIIETFRMLAIVGTDSSIGMMSNSFHTILKNVELYGLLSNDFETNAMNFMNESMRHTTPVQMALRACIDDFELGGKEIKKGQLVAIMIGAANRDAEVFINPESFQISRNNSSMLTYGKGIHFCMGFHVSKIITKIAMKEFIKIISNVKIQEHTMNYSHSPMVMKLSELQLKKIKPFTQ